MLRATPILTPLLLADFNNDEVIDVQDVNDFNGAYNGPP